MNRRSYIIKKTRARLIVYALYVLLIVTMSLTFSRYTVRDGGGGGARVVTFGTEMEIDSGEPTYALNYADIRLYATGSIAEAESIREGVYACSVVRIHNRSDCTIRFDDLSFAESAEGERMAYSNVIIDGDMDYIEDHRASVEDNGIALSVLSYLQETMADYNRQPAAVSNDKERAELEYLQTTFASDPDFTYNGAPLDYEPSLLREPAYLRQLLAACNKVTLEKINRRYEGGAEILPRGKRTLLVISWMEHGSLYRADALTEADRISHKTPTELIGDGNRAEVRRSFSFSAHFSQTE